MSFITETLQTHLESSDDQPSFISCDLVDKDLVDAIWRELGGQISREDIWLTACSVAQSYRDASITTYIHIFIRRQTMELLAR